jgi:eukaryotic-like serine/threonine-protein kinase
LERIGRFELARVLGKGASGTVYLAVDTFSGDAVALKVLDPILLAAPDFESTVAPQFLNEASLAGKLSHPHIAAILEASVSRDSGYIAIEYVPGGDLSQYASPGNLLPPQKAIQVAFKSCGALDYAFKQGIVHRDIKPANIMVVTGTNIKVADFGAAYLKMGKETQITEIGSPYYMSPEQIRRENLAEHSDMFSLGVVLYELFTGCKPFTADTLEGLFASILKVTPARPTTLRPELWPELDELLLRMLAKSPGERYPSWPELALEIARIGRLSVYEQEIPDSDKFTSLKAVPLLQDLGDAELWELVHAGRWKRLPSQRPIVREGEEGNSLFFLATGQAKVTRNGRLLSVLSSGECFGDMAYVKKGGMSRQATVEAITDVVVAEFDSQALATASMNCRLQLSDALLDSLVERLALANERLGRAQ